MDRLFSTVGLPARERFNYWHDVACKTIIEHDSRPDPPQAFYAAIDHGVVGNLRLLLFENAPMTVSRTARHIARARTDDLFVCRQTAGALQLEQSGRQLILQAGDITLLDPMLPYQAKFLSGSKLLVLKVSRCELEARVGNGRDLVALSIKPIGAEAKVISEVLGMLPTYAELASSGVQEITGNYAIDLIAISLALSFDTSSPRLSPAKALVSSLVRAAVEARLTQPDLDTDQIAAAIGVTARYANTVLGQQGTSISRLIQERRLERCRAALEDLFQEKRNVSDIAYAWGFSDMTHFGRAFKKRFGISPREYRRVYKDLGVRPPRTLQVCE